MNFSVRQIELTGGYVDAIERMDRVCFPGEHPVNFEGSYWWFAFDEDGVPAAYAGLALYWGSTGFLCRAGVLPQARGHGLQKRLIRARERGARGMEIMRMVSYTTRSNVQSSNNLIACGYRLYRPQHMWVGPEALYWWRNL